MIRTLNGFYVSTLDRVGFIVAAIALAICLLGVAIYLFGKAKLFSKCGQDWWLALIPFYGDYIFITKICGLHWAWFVGYIAVTLVSLGKTAVTALRLFVNAASFYNLGIRCNRDKTAAMIFGAIFPSVVTVIYGLTSSITYNKDIEVKESGLF